MMIDRDHLQVLCSEFGAKMEALGAQGLVIGIDFGTSIEASVPVCNDEAFYMIHELNKFVTLREYFDE